MSNTHPIHAEMQGNKQDQADWLGLERIAPGFDEASGDVSSFHSGSNGARGDLEAGAADSARKGKSVVTGDTCIEKSPGAMNQWDISFGDLLALAEGSSMVPRNHISTSHGASLMLHGAHNIAPGSNSQFYGHCTAENNGLSVPSQFTYDLNFPPGIVGNAVSRTAVPQFAPMTPNKAGRAENNHVSEAQSLHAYYKGTHEENENEVATLGVVRIDGSSSLCAGFFFGVALYFPDKSLPQHFRLVLVGG